MAGGEAELSASAAPALLRARLELAERLRARGAEIEEALLVRIYAIGDPREASEAGYPEGLKGALTAALAYGLEAIEAGEERVPPIPIPLLAQARLAARAKVSLDTVLRRYFAGYTLLGEFLIREAAELQLKDAALEGLLHAHSLALDRLLAAVSEEHAREVGGATHTSAAHRRLRTVRRLLAGEQVETTELRYPLGAHHTAIVCEGPGAERLAREVATLRDRALIAVSPERDVLWAWLGGGRPLDAAELREQCEQLVPAGASVAVGEPAEGLSGWRLTHRQAAAALPVARCGAEPVVRYRDVALLATAMQDHLLVTSLRRLYLEPLERMRDRGETARETLRAYFEAGRNVSSTAVALGVNRNTVGNRLPAIEAVIGCSLPSCARELELALHLEEIAV